MLTPEALSALFAPLKLKVAPDESSVVRRKSDLGVAGGPQKLRNGINMLTHVNP